MGTPTHPLIVHLPKRAGGVVHQPLSDESSREDEGDIELVVPQQGLVDREVGRTENKTRSQRGF